MNGPVNNPPTLDRYDVSLAIQVWMHFFMRALVQGLVSNLESVWKENKHAALEYLARGRMMQAIGRFCDGIDTGVEILASDGLTLIVGAEAVAALGAEIDAKYSELNDTLRARTAELADHGIDVVRAELARVPEMRREHRALFGAVPKAVPPAPEEQPGALPGAAFLDEAERHARKFFRPG